jgi:hypothetical protein
MVAFEWDRHWLFVCTARGSVGATTPLSRTWGHLLEHSQMQMRSIGDTEKKKKKKKKKKKQRVHGRRAGCQKYIKGKVGGVVWGFCSIVVRVE